ncbi:TetR/AcrR family transcriptional regulator [Streptomyces umbrinus]|uniref:TetR/AcrR family transcriptional regulator n=1 Tax=Streptomyces umbrinus TaxID=67370 RepID=UPI0033FE90F0
MPPRSRARDGAAAVASGSASGSGSGPDSSSNSSSDFGSDSAVVGRERTRQRVIEAAADLLAREGRDAVTTRAVAVAAGLQPPAIYRLFGDKDGLLEAVAEHGFATFLAAKHVDPDPQDLIEDLRAGWDLAVEFGLANPALYTLMYSEPTRVASPAFKAGMEILMGRIRRLAAGGRLRVDEELAATLIHATARGAVLTWLSLPEDRRNPALLTILRESMVAAVTNEEPAVQDAGPAGAARALRATLPEQTTLSGAEQHLLREWLDRLASEG